MTPYKDQSEEIRKIADETTRRLVLEIARALVDDEESISVEVCDVDGLSTVRVRLTASDLGKVVGAQGRTARCIRSLLTASATKYDRRYGLDIRAHEA